MTMGDVLAAIAGRQQASQPLEAILDETRGSLDAMLEFGSDELDEVMYELASELRSVERNTSSALSEQLGETEEAMAARTESEVIVPKGVNRHQRSTVLECDLHKPTPTLQPKTRPSWNGVPRLGPPPRGDPSGPASRAPAPQRRTLQFFPPAPLSPPPTGIMPYPLICEFPSISLTKHPKQHKATISTLEHSQREILVTL